VFKKSVNYITAGLIIDPEATTKNYKTFTALIIIKIKISIKRLIGCFSAISNKLVYEPIIGILFVIEIKYIL